MSDLEVLVKAWDNAHWEFSLVFEGLGDEDVWNRADPRLLSVGELAGHIAFWEAAGLLPEEPGIDIDMTKVAIKSPLVDRAFRYYTSSVGKPVQLELSAADVLKECQRVHEEGKAEFLRSSPNSGDLVPGRDKLTYGQVLEYRVFHVAYHTGQAFSVRHLLGHTTTDN